MYVDLKKFILGIAEQKEIKLHSFTINAIDDAVRAAKNQKDVAVDDIMEMLKKKDELKKGFGSNDWNAIEHQVEKMLK
ncbi:MAG TPA: hypothetical protein DEA43_02210 [Candidatus Moranbacteria bacterium]|nr:hypothetical protein [Candidatus Moranbacteria bacterium]HBT45678.1 hypothetical protein [Candidatus Moranbacteria bacterium]